MIKVIPMFNPGICLHSAAVRLLSFDWFSGHGHVSQYNASLFKRFKTF